MRVQLALVMAVMAGSTAHAAVGGTYNGPLGGMDIKVKGGQVVGTSLGGGPCGFKKGQPVLKGTLMDDSVAGKLTVCATGDGCGMEEAFAVLLVARKGALLSGAVQVKGKQCTLPTRGKGLQLTRTPAPGGDKARPKDAGKKEKPAKGEKPAEAGPSDGGGDAAPMGGNTASAEPAASTESTTRFEDWSPVPADGKPVEGNRRAAIGKAKEAEPLLNAGQFEAARPLLLDALKADPGYAEGYNMVGVTFYARDRYDDALDWYKKALTVNPDFGDAYYNIACIYAVEGKKPLALKYLRIALLNGYADLRSMEKDGDLDSIRAEPEYAEIIKLVKGGAAPAPVQEKQPAPEAPPAAPPPQEPPMPDAPPSPPQ